MLVLNRKKGEVLCIGGNIRVTVLGYTKQGAVKLGIEAPKEVTVHREEIFNRVGNNPIK